MLSDVGDGASVLTTQTQALQHPQAEEDEGSSHTNLVESRDQSNGTRRKSHAAQRHEERVLAANTIAEPPKQEGPERADQEPSREQSNRAQQRRDGMRLLEEPDRQSLHSAPWACETALCKTLN